MSSVRAFRHYLNLSVLIVGLAEAVTAGAALIAVARFLPAAHEAVGMEPWQAFLFASVVAVSLGAVGLYQLRLRTGPGGIAFRILVAFIFGAGLLTAAYAAFPELNPGERVVGTAGLLAFGVVLAVHTTFFAIVDTSPMKRRVLVLGAGRHASSLTGLRRRADRRGFEIVGYVPIGERKPHVRERQLIRDPMSIPALIRHHAVDEVVVAMDDRRSTLPINELLECRLRGIPVTDIRDFYEREAGKVRLDLISPAWLIFSDGFRRAGMRRLTKRLFDLTASLLLLAVSWPAMALAALAIWLEDQGPLLFRQERVGEDGRRYEVLKFRSMRVDAEKDGRARWATSNDARVTRVGRFIRKTRIDELPQIFNVLRGDMSFVGPRPERPEFVGELSRSIPYYGARHAVKPGITGWAQLCYPYGASREDAAEKLQFDLYYLKNHSLLLDLIILVQTVEVVLFGKGAR